MLGLVSFPQMKGKCEYKCVTFTALDLNISSAQGRQHKPNQPVSKSWDVWVFVVWHAKREWESK